MSARSLSRSPPLTTENNNGDEPLTGTTLLTEASPVNEASSKLPDVPASSLRTASPLHQLSAANTVNDASEAEPAEEPWDTIRPAQNVQLRQRISENINQNTNAFLELIRLLNTTTHPLVGDQYQDIFTQCSTSLSESKQLVEKAIESSELTDQDKYYLIDVLLEQTQQCFTVLCEKTLTTRQPSEAQVITTLIVNLLVRCCQCSYSSQSPGRNGSLYEKSVLCFLNPIGQYHSQLRTLIESTDNPVCLESLKGSFIYFLQRIQEHHFFRRTSEESEKMGKSRFEHMPSFFQLITLGLALCRKSDNENLKTLLAYGCDKLARGYNDFFKLCLEDSQQQSPVNYADSLKDWRWLNSAKLMEEASQITTTATPTQIKFLSHIATNHHETGYINANFITQNCNTIQRFVHGLFATPDDDRKPITTVLAAMQFPEIVQVALLAITKKSGLGSDIAQVRLEEFFKSLITGAADQIAKARQATRRGHSSNDIPDTTSGRHSMRSHHSNSSTASSSRSISASELKALLDVRAITQTEITLSLPPQETDDDEAEIKNSE